MGQHAALGGDVVTGDDIVQQAEQAPDGGQAVRSRVDADDRVPGAVLQAVDDGGQHAARVIGGMVGLQARGKTPRQADGIAKARHHAALGGHQHQILDAHELAGRGHHLRGQARRQGRQGRRVRGGGQQPVAQLAHREGADRRKGLRIVAVHDEPGDLVRLVRHHALRQETLQGHIGQGHLGPDALFLILGRDAGQDVSRTQGRGFGQQFAQGTFFHRIFQKLKIAQRHRRLPCPYRGTAAAPQPDTPSV